MSATSTMTSQRQSWRDGPRITTISRQQSPPSSPCTPSSPKWGEDRRPLSWNECKVGKVVYLPAQEEIAANSRILRQTYGGRKWEHPAVILKVDEINGFVEIMVVRITLFLSFSYLASFTPSSPSFWVSLSYPPPPSHGVWDMLHNMRPRLPIFIIGRSHTTYFCLYCRQQLA